MHAGRVKNTFGENVYFMPGIADSNGVRTESHRSYVLKTTCVGEIYGVAS